MLGGIGIGMLQQITLAVTSDASTASLAVLAAILVLGVGARPRHRRGAR